MDPVTHGLAAALIKNSGFRRKGALPVLLISSIIPDLDFLVWVRGADAVLKYHRGITHGIFALIAFPLVIGLLYGRKKGFLYCFSLAFLGLGVHTLFDLAGDGVRLFAPLDNELYALKIIYVVDPYITVLLLVGLMMSLQGRKTVSIALLTIMLSASYMGARYFFRERTEDFLRADMKDSVCAAYPIPGSMLRWWFTAETPESVKTGFSDLLTGRTCVQDVYAKEQSPAVERSKKSRAVRNFLSFAKKPHASVEKEGERVVVTWMDLSGAFMPGGRFQARAVMDRDGSVLDSKFRF